MNSLTGEMLLLPPKYIDEYKNIPELSMTATTAVVRISLDRFH